MERRLSAILAADVVGYSRMMGADEAGTLDALKAMRAEVDKEYLLGKVEFDASVRSTPVVANGVTYVMTENALYAFKKK